MIVEDSFYERATGPESSSTVRPSLDAETPDDREKARGSSQEFDSAMTRNSRTPSETGKYQVTEEKRNGNENEIESGLKEETLQSEPNGHDLEKAETRHIEVQWDGEDDPMSPRNLPTWRKWHITLTVSVGAVCVYVFPVLCSRS